MHNSSPSWLLHEARGMKKRQPNENLWERPRAHNIKYLMKFIMADHPSSSFRDDMDRLYNWVYFVPFAFLLCQFYGNHFLLMSQ